LFIRRNAEPIRNG